MQPNIQNRTMGYLFIIAGILLIICLIMAHASANSVVEVPATSDSGTFNFMGTGGYCDWYLDISGWDEANVDIANHWDYATSNVIYQDVGDGEIFVKIKDRSHNNQWMYYDWGTIPINGNGIYVPPFGGGGRYVNVTGSPNVTGEIECIVGMERAVFQFDTQHHETDLTVLVHNGEVLENATVSLINGNPIVVWTDELGEAKFTVGTGTYHLVIEHENFSSMLVDDLYLEADKSYHIRVNMTDCLSSSGVALCSPDADDLIIYYKNKEPAMGSISPQGFVDYFADQLRTCMGGDNPCATNTLQWMADDWGIYPSELNVLLDSCTITKIGCIDGMQELEITYCVKNYQQYECSYTVNLVYGDTTIELGSGYLPKTWSQHSKITTTSLVAIDGCEPTSTVYLVVESEKIE